MDITLVFKGQNTLKEMYQIHVQTFRKALMLACGNSTYQEKMEKKRELLEYVALIDEAMFSDQYPHLSCQPRYEDSLNNRKEIKPTHWTIDHQGRRIELEDDGKEIVG